MKDKIISELDEIKVKALTQYEEDKDDKLFQLLYDCRDTLLPYEFTKIGIRMDGDVLNFLNGYASLKYFHILDDGGVRYNSKYDVYKKTLENAILTKNINVISDTIKTKPTFFTLLDDDSGEMLNGNGENMEEIYNHCIRYLKEEYFSFLKYEHRDKMNYMKEKYEHIFIKYLDNNPFENINI